TTARLHSRRCPRGRAASPHRRRRERDGTALRCYLLLLTGWPGGRRCSCERRRGPREPGPDRRLGLAVVERGGEGAAQDERGGADRPFRVVPGIDLDGDAGERGEQVAAERRLERVRDVRPRLSALAADEHELRAEDVDDACDGTTERRTGLREDRPRPIVGCRDLAESLDARPA